MLTRYALAAAGLFIFYAGLSLFVGWQIGCPPGDLGRSIVGCGESWAFRYQTLAAGVAAILIGFLAAGVASRQAEIANRQVLIMEAQAKAARSRSISVIDNFLRALEQAGHRLAAASLHTIDLWQVNGVAPFSLPITQDELAASAAEAFPGRETDLGNALAAASRLNAAYVDFEAAPWQLTPSSSDADRQAAAPRMQEAAEAVQAFTAGLAKVRDLMPENRQA